MLGRVKLPGLSQFAAGIRRQIIKPSRHQSAELTRIDVQSQGRQIRAQTTESRLLSM
jgi:hypothetical protein